MTKTEAVPLYTIPKGCRAVIVEVPEGQYKSKLNSL